MVIRFLLRFDLNFPTEHTSSAIFISDRSVHQVSNIDYTGVTT